MRHQHLIFDENFSFKLWVAAQYVFPSWHIYFVQDCCQKRGHSANFFVEELNASLDDDAFPLNANIERKQGLHAEPKRQVSL